jgi:signal transduction histidine kinase
LTATVDQLLEPAVQLESSMTVSDLAVRLHGDEPGFLRTNAGWEAVLPHLLIAQPASRRVIDVPRLSVEAVSRDASLADLPALLGRTPLGSSPVVDGPSLVGRIDHERLRAWLGLNAESAVAEELVRLRRATQAILHDLMNLLVSAGTGVGEQKDAGTQTTILQAVELAKLLRKMHSGAPLPSRTSEVGEIVTGLVPLMGALAGNVARVEIGALERIAALCPPALIERTVISLLTNSREAMIHGGRGGCIYVDVDADDREVRMRVRDDGPGVPDHVVGRLFERGFSTKGTERGTGLAGLREAARWTGGDLRFERGTKGATFVLALRRA